MKKKPVKDLEEHFKDLDHNLRNAALEMERALKRMDKAWKSFKQCVGDNNWVNSPKDQDKN